MPTPTSSPLLRYPERAALLPSLYMAPAAYYAAALSYGRVEIDDAIRYDKRRKEVHRCAIVDARGRLQLTVPVSVPHGVHDRALRWSDVEVSSHGGWWNVHRTALESAYGRTPFFEFLIDRFAPVLRSPEPGLTVTELNRRAHDIILSILTGWNGEYECDIPAKDTDDFRKFNFQSVEMRPYRQIRASQLGFCEGLSVLDMIFNLGPATLNALREPDIRSAEGIQ